MPEEMRLPRAFFVLRIFVPVAGRAGEGNDDHVLPAVVVEIAGEASERLAVIERVVFRFGVAVGGLSRGAAERYYMMRGYEPGAYNSTGNLIPMMQVNGTTATSGTSK